MISVARFALALLALTAVSACETTTSEVAPVMSLKEFGPPDGVSDAMGTSDYRLGTNDVLTIKVRQDEKLDRDVRVDGEGKIVLAQLVDPVRAGGLTIGELTQRIKDSYQSVGIRQPDVSVFVKEYGSQRLTVLGAVSKPGVFILDGPTTLTQSLGLAGGMTDAADTSQVVVVRTLKGRRIGAKFDMAAFMVGGSTDPQVYGTDVVIVGQSAMQSFMKNFGSFLPIFSVIPLL